MLPLENYNVKVNSMGFFTQVRCLPAVLLVLSCHNPRPPPVAPPAL